MLSGLHRLIPCDHGRSGRKRPKHKRLHPYPACEPSNRHARWEISCLSFAKMELGSVSQFQDRSGNVFISFI